MRIEVDFAASGEGPAVPVAVRFGARMLKVRDVVDRWYGQHFEWWKFDTEDGQFILRREDSTGEWTLAALPNQRPAPSPAASGSAGHA